MVRRMVLVMVIVVVMAGMAPTHAQDDAAYRNKAAVREALAQLSAGNVEGFFQLYADQFQANQGDAALYDTTAEDLASFTNALVAAIPHLHVVPKVIIAQGDRVAAELSFSGTFSQPFSFAPFGPDPLPPTNQRVSWTEMHFLRFNDEGKVIEDWGISDPSYMLSQLGVMPHDAENQISNRLTPPAGYQRLNADALAATYTSSRENETVALFQEQVDLLGLGADAAGYYTDPYVSWDGGIPSVVNTEDDLEFLQALSVAMPDLTVSAEIVVAQGDWVAGLVTITGTFTNELNLVELGTIPPTGQSVVWQLGIIDRYNAHGKVVEEWIESDTSPMLIALGLMPPMERDD